MTDNRPAYPRVRCAGCGNIQVVAAEELRKCRCPSCGSTRGLYVVPDDGDQAPAPLAAGDTYRTR